MSKLTGLIENEVAVRVVYRQKEHGVSQVVRGIIVAKNDQGFSLLVDGDILHISFANIVYLRKDRGFEGGDVVKPVVPRSRKIDSFRYSRWWKNCTVKEAGNEQK